LKHIVLSCNENYARYAAVLVHSVVKNSTGKFAFYIITNSFSTKTTDALQKFGEAIAPHTLNICTIDTTSLDALPSLNGNKATYFRLFLSRVLPPEVATCLYLDTDMLCTGDISPLFETNLEGALCAAVRENAKRSREFLAPLSPNLPRIKFNASYFNAGVLLIDLKKWREERVEEQLLHIVQNYRLVFHDQDALNAVLKSRVKILPFEWNFFASAFFYPIARDVRRKFYVNYTQSELLSAASNLRLVHFLHADKKPWQNAFVAFFRGEFVGQKWWREARETPVFGGLLKEPKMRFEVKFGLFVLREFGSWRGIFGLPFATFRFARETNLAACFKTLDEPNSEIYNTASEVGRAVFETLWRVKNGGLKGRLKAFSLWFRVRNIKKRIEKFGRI